MSNKVQCATHGESEKAFVCTHLLGEDAGLGFNRDEPTPENMFPDAWCDDCEIIRAAHGGWDEESEKLKKITLLCSGCYERSRIRNTRTAVTLSDLAGLRWKCGSCDEWHTGPCLDFSYDAPIYWRKQDEANSHQSKNREQLRTFLNDDYCSIEGRDFFVRGIIHLPIVGTTETLRWGVWGSPCVSGRASHPTKTTLGGAALFVVVPGKNGDQKAGQPPGDPIRRSVVG